MKWLGAAMAAAGVAVLAAAIWIAVWSQAEDGWIVVLTWATPIVVWVNLGLGATLLWAALYGFNAAADEAQREALLRRRRLALWIAPAVGALITLWRLLIIQQIVVETNTTNFMVVAPTLSAALPPVAFGLFAGAAAAFRIAWTTSRGASRA